MIKYFKKKFLKKVINFYHYQVLSLSMEIGYNDKYSKEEINHMSNKIDKFNEIINNTLRHILVDLDDNKF